MANKTGKTVLCNESTRSGRRKKAVQFHQVAQDVAALADDGDDIADAYVTLLVHAGIAAADLLCCASLGEHAQGDNHTEAIALLAKVNIERSKDLSTLLKMKTKAGYSHQHISKQERAKAQRACDRLIEAVEDLPA